MITLNRLQQIIPSDQALANKALSVALGQINGISSINLPIFSAAIEQLETTKDLPLISALQQAVPPSVANYYTSTLAVGGGTNGDIRVVDVIGLAAGWVATDAFARTVEIYSTMDLTTLTTIYQTMSNALAGNYGDIAAGPLTIPGGLPCAGTYNGSLVPPDPGPPPTPGYYDPTAISLAMTCLTNAATTEIMNLETAYPEQTTELNTLWNNMAQQVVQENTLQPIVGLDYNDLTANDRNSIYGFIYNLPSYGLQIEQGGMAWFVEAVADLSGLGGQAVVACLREGRNEVVLNSAGIYTNNKIPADASPPPPDAELIPSVYSESEAVDLVDK
jgi:hypothetical protein